MLFISIAILAPLFIYSLRDGNKYLYANIGLALLLPTLDRLSGGLPFPFAYIKIPFLFIGFFIQFIRVKKIAFNNNIQILLVLYIVFIVSLLFSLEDKSGLSVIKSLTSWGLIYLPLIIISGEKSIDVLKLIKFVFNFIFIPTAIFGIFQYIVGPEFLSSIGFKLVTHNTETTYAFDLVSFETQQYYGFRPFSFLTSSADYSAIVFQAYIWNLVLGDFMDFQPRIKTVIIFLFAIALLVSQTMTMILIALAIHIYYVFFIKKIRVVSQNVIFAVAGIISFAFIFNYFFPEITNRILYSVKIYSPDDVGTTSLGYRLRWLSMLPTLIQGHLFFGYGSAINFPHDFSADSKFFYHSLINGLITGVIYLSLYAYVAKISWQGYIKKKKLIFYNEIKLLVYLMSTAVILNNLSNGQIELTTPSNFLLWIIIGISLSNAPRIFGKGNAFE